MIQNHRVKIASALLTVGLGAIAAAGLSWGKVSIFKNIGGSWKAGMFFGAGSVMMIAAAILLKKSPAQKLEEIESPAREQEEEDLYYWHSGNATYCRSTNKKQFENAKDSLALFENRFLFYELFLGESSSLWCKDTQAGEFQPAIFISGDGYTQCFFTEGDTLMLRISSADADPFDITVNEGGSAGSGPNWGLLEELQNFPVHFN